MLNIHNQYVQYSIILAVSFIVFMGSLYTMDYLEDTCVIMPYYDVVYRLLSGIVGFIQVLGVGMIYLLHRLVTNDLKRVTKPRSNIEEK